MFIQKTAPSRRVLLADDDAVTRLLVTSLVEQRGYTIVSVEDGGRAVRVLKDDSDFCAAIFDMMMPALQGLDVIKFMRTEKRLMRIPTLLISANRDLRLVETSFAAGVTLFLTKPFTNEQFQTALRLLLGGSAQFDKAR